MGFLSAPFRGELCLMRCSLAILEAAQQQRHAAQTRGGEWPVQLIHSSTKAKWRGGFLGEVKVQNCCWTARGTEEGRVPTETSQRAEENLNRNVVGLLWA